MDKKKLKLLLNLLGIILLFIAIIVTLKTGISEVGHYDWSMEWEATGHKFFIEDVKFVYVVPLLIGSLVCFIIAACLKPKKDNIANKYNNLNTTNNTESTTEKLIKLKELLDKKLISEDEFNTKKSEILSQEF